MSTLFFLKDHGKHKRGQRGTVALAIANDLVAAGVAVRWDGGKGEELAKEIYDAEREAARPKKPEPVPAPKPPEVPPVTETSPEPLKEPTKAEASEAPAHNDKDKKKQKN